VSSEPADEPGSVPTVEALQPVKEFRRRRPVVWLAVVYWIPLFVIAFHLLHGSPGDPASLFAGESLRALGEAGLWVTLFVVLLGYRPLREAFR